MKMLRLDIRFSDGTTSQSWGGVDWIEAAIERAAESAKTIVTWAVRDE